MILDLIKRRRAVFPVQYNHTPEKNNQSFLHWKR